MTATTPRRCADGSLTTLNDAGRTFDTLANIIEAGDEA